MVYRVGFPPKAVEQLGTYVEEQLIEVGENLDAIDNLTLVELHEEPAKPRTGLIVLADGTDWNPGSGQGVYAYHGGAWNLLG